MLEQMLRNYDLSLISRVLLEHKRSKSFWILTQVTDIVSSLACVIITDPKSEGRPKCTLEDNRTETAVWNLGCVIAIPFQIISKSQKSLFPVGALQSIPLHQYSGTQNQRPTLLFVILSSIGTILFKLLIWKQNIAQSGEEVASSSFPVKF